MLKTQQNVRQREFKNVEISYANDPISEYIGSHVYDICGVPVHYTVLGKYNGKICVLCEDTVYPSKVIEFREWRNRIMSEDIVQHHSGMSSRICDIIEIIDNIEIFNKEVLQRFWDMFVIDALIGNTDRNNGNWGFYIDGGELKLYNVYDCGGCLDNKRSDEQLGKSLKDGTYEDFAYNFTTSIMDNKGKRINPLHYIRDNSNKYIANALNKLPLNMLQISKMISYMQPVISPVREEWYCTMILCRLEFLLGCKLNAPKPNGLKLALMLMSGE